MFSSRLNWDLSPNPLSKLLQAKRSSSVQILDLTESNPTRAGLPYPADQILAALADPHALRYDPEPRGLASARDAIGHYYADRGRQVAPSQILLTASTSEAYSYLFKLLADPGDEILTPRPSYPLFEFLAALESVKVRQYPLRYDGAWNIDFAALQQSIHKNTRAIVIVNPNNPTGSSISPDDFERLESFGLPILSDEVFSDYSRAPHIVPRRTLTFSMNGLSKIAGLPQMKLGWILADGPGHESALDRLELIADTFLSVATPVQLALPKLLESTAAVREAILERTDENFALLRAICAGSAFQPLHRDAGWYAILQVPRTRTEEEWALMLLSEFDVLVQPGFFFDFESEAFLVLSLLTDPHIFEQGLRQIRACDK